MPSPANRAGAATEAAKVVLDAAVRHRIALGRYSTTVVRKVIAQLNRVEIDLIARLARTDNESVSGVRLQLLLNEIRTIQSAGWRVITRQVEADVTELAGSEATFAQSLVEHVDPTLSVDVFSPVPPISQIVAAVQARPFQGRILKDWLAGTDESIAARVRDVIRQGFIEGRPTADIVRTLRGTAAAGYKDGVLEGTRRNVEAVVRTALTHTSSVAHEAVYRANADVITGVEWVSVLDNRTTLICISLDGKVFPIDKGPRPPAHFGCRSTTSPHVGPIDGVPALERTTYAQWLKGQPASVQDDILGPTRGRLYRQGGLTVDRFVDRAGHTLTLDQLRARDAASFAKAGL